MEIPRNLFIDLQCNATVSQVCKCCMLYGGGFAPTTMLSPYRSIATAIFINLQCFSAQSVWSVCNAVTLNHTLLKCAKITTNVGKRDPAVNPGLPYFTADE